MVRYGAERVLPSVNSRSGCRRKANAAIKPRAETACRLCRGGAVKGRQRRANGGCEQANKRTNEQGRSGMFVFVRVRFCSLCSLCSLLFGLFGFVRCVRCVRFCSPPCSFVRLFGGVFSFPFSVFSSLKKPMANG